MRHILVLGLITALMAFGTGMAYKVDVELQQAVLKGVTEKINADMQKLEQQYFASARTLLALRNPKHPLLQDIATAQAVFFEMDSSAERDVLFQALAMQIRAELMSAPQDDASQQEWRRMMDQLNGALHRRNQLLSRLQEAR